MADKTYKREAVEKRIAYLEAELEAAGLMGGNRQYLASERADLYRQRYILDRMGDRETWTGDLRFIKFSA